MRKLFADLGYQLGPSLDEPSAGELRLILCDWLSSVELSSTDALVIYYSGHGFIAGAAHYLCTKGCDPTRVGATAFKTEDLLELVVRRRDRPGNLWLILDCCQAGGVLSEGLCRGILGEQTGVFVLAASSSWGQTVDGAFSTAMHDALAAGPLPPGTAPGPTSLSLDGLAHELNRRRPSSRVLQAGVSSSRFEFLAPVFAPAIPRQIPRQSVQVVLSWALAVIALVGTPCSRFRGATGGAPEDELFRDRQEIAWRSTPRTFPHIVVFDRRRHVSLLRRRHRRPIWSGNALAGI
jgi:hypothetical protein